MEQADVEALLRLVFGWGALQLGSAATGRVDLQWPRGRPRQISGTLTVDLAERPDGRLPLAGRLAWHARDGLQDYDRLELRGQGLRAALSGQIDPSGRARLALDAETADIAAADAALVQVRRGLGNAEAQPSGLTGSGSFAGRWRGSVDWPVLEGRFAGSNVGYLDVDWGRAEWTGRLDTRAEAIDSHSLVLRKGAGELWWDGRTEIGWYGVRDALSGRARIQGWPVRDLVTFMGWQVVASGLASGEARVGGRRSAPSGEARVTASDGRYYDVPYARARISARWSDRVAEVASGEVELGSGQLSFQGTLDDDGVYDASGRVEGVDLGTLLPPTAGGVAYGGRLAGSFLLRGTLARPRVVASVRSPRLFFGDEGIGALDAQVTGLGDGRLSVEARCRSPRLELSLTGAVAAVSPYEAALTLQARTTSVDPFLRALQPALPAALALIASGQATVRGPLAEPESLRADASLPQLELQLPEYVVRASEPVRLTYAQGRFDIAQLRLAGEGTDLQLAGGGDLLGSGPLEVSARGRADLRALALVTRRLRGSGTAQLRADLGGTISDPRLDGQLELQGAGLRVRGFPHGIEGLHGRVRFSESAAELSGVSGSLAGGRLSVEGQAAYAGGRLTSYDIRPSGNALGLRYPEGTRSLIDARLRLFGDASRQWLTGDIDVRQALYTRRYDVASELLGARRALAPLAAASLDEGARLDLRIHAPGTLRVDNNLATLAARAELSLQGTARAPVLTGHAEIERGRLYFQGGTYHVQRGVLDFVNPQRLDPLFDIEAETRVRSYRVTLRVSGTLERVTPTLTSDPPLSSLQILALLAGQDESEVVSLTQTEARQSQAQLAAAGAATLAAGRLSESVGLEREAERLFGLNRFSIDPSLLRGAGTTPTARVTVGKRLTPDLNVLYSQDVRGTEERILAVEYTLSDRFSLLLTRTDPGTAKTGVERGWAFDVRIRQSH
jgi:autotransporter translocation and assembly factor TamB